jgi:phosphate transport system substrate-binding protein
VVKVDGSSTVFPITEAVAEEFQKLHPGVKVTVGVSGTGGGFKKFTTGETDISDASRPIEETERKAAQEKGIEYLELRVAIDGLSVMVNPANTWVDCLTTEELRKIWEPGSQIKNWNQVRPGFPDVTLRLYGPGTDSGTFDYFTKEIVGEEDASRGDYTASEDDNVLVQGIAGDKGALGYFGYAYYVENQGRLKLLAIDAGKGCIRPTEKTIADGTYSPLSRPLFIYVSKNSLQRPEVLEFVKFYLTQAPELVPQVGYTPLPKTDYEKGLAAVEAATS